MITPQKARQDYQAAMSALEAIIFNPDSSPEQRDAAMIGVREVTSRFLQQIETELNALSAQYVDFIRSISAITTSLQSSGGPLAAIQTLSGLVTQGTAIMNAATGAVGAAGPAPAGARNVSGVGASRAPLKILCVHGVGHHEADQQSEIQWRLAIGGGVFRWNANQALDIQFVKYDDLFAAASLTALDVAEAVVKLSVSGVVHAVGDLFRRRRAFGALRESVRWTAGMVVQWAENDRLRATSRTRIKQFFGRDKFNPDVIMAHSLGSLLSYDLFAREQELLEGRMLVTFGSQIGNPFVRSTLGGRICPLDTARRWYHLFNKHDDAFTAELRVSADNFEQVQTHFDISGMLDHDAGAYLRQPNTNDIVWRAIATPASAARGASKTTPASEVVAAKQAAKARPSTLRRPPRKALLVGINDYPNPADRLNGCVNDVFLMSELLQECGFDADNIRVVLNERATAQGLIERLQWLLEGSEDGQDRVFYYSGHGAQIPGYGVGDAIDHTDECLVTYDFDWTREKSITDDQFYELYSQLPYNTRFLTIFDCCHSGGMTREGGARVRGLNPPDDIRHRELKWDKGEKMWVARDFSKRRPMVGERKKRPDIYGESGAVNRLGRAAVLRPERSQFNKATEDFGHVGPFMPVIIQACKETQFAYEYRHGVQSYGAFTYAMSLVLREGLKGKKPISWEQLVKRVSAKLEWLEYDQVPCLVCATKLRNDPIPARP
jgi:hypothetical protein